MVEFIVMVVAILATPPLTIWGVRFAKKHRRTASAAVTLLLMFGLNMKVDPPSPPQTETVRREEEEAKDDEPK